MSLEGQIVHGIAQRLADAGIGTWSTTEPYTAGQIGIYDGPIRSETVEGIGLATYPVDDPVDSESTIGVQIAFRSASKTTIRDRAAAVFGQLHAVWGWQIDGGPRIDHMMRRSSADLGMDEIGTQNAGAYRRTDNYYVTVNNPTPNRL